MYCDSIDGVRKQLTITPFSGRGGNVPGTPRTIERLPYRVARSQRRGALTAEPLATKRPSYEWSARFRKP